MSQANPKIVSQSATAASKETPETLYLQPVWDIAIRLFHWALVVLMIVLIVTGKLGGNWLEWHQLAGYAVLALIIFRIVWGFVGSYHARFINFVHGPRTVVSYIKSIFRKTPVRYAGHNPLGAWSTLVLLAVTLVQAVTGLFSNDDVMLEGPFAAKVSKEISDWLTGLHKWNANLLFILIGIHLLAILFYIVIKKEQLIKPMITGKKMLPASLEISSMIKVWLAPLIFSAIVGVIYFLVKK